jgi:DNA-binding transcriptional ArsR family regulator
LRTLGLLADTPAGLTPTELAERLGVSRPVVYRLLTTLMAHGYARRDAEGRAFLGPAAFRLGRGTEPQLRAAATPVLRKLAEEVGATAHLTIADGSEALAIAVVEPSWTDLHVAYRVGSRHPLELGAAGLAILGARRGYGTEYSVSESQLQHGAFGIAAAVPGLGLIEASVGVVALQRLDIEIVAPRVVRAAAECAAIFS